SQALAILCDRYEDWIRRCTIEAKSLSTQFRRAAERNLEWCRLTATRMRAGVELIASDERVRESFMLMNQALLMQQIHSRLRRRLGEQWTDLPTIHEYRSNWEAGVGYWRAFQLAYILTTLSSVGRSDPRTVTLPSGEQVSERELVELIWFPTGGGKTE